MSSRLINAGPERVSGAEAVNFYLLDGRHRRADDGDRKRNREQVWTRRGAHRCSPTLALQLIWVVSQPIQ